MKPPDNLFDLEVGQWLVMKTWQFQVYQVASITPRQVRVVREGSTSRRVLKHSQLYGVFEAHNEAKTKAVEANALYGKLEREIVNPIRAALVNALLDQERIIKETMI